MGITFIATGFKEKWESYVFVYSLLSQKNPNWKAIIYCNQKGNSEMRTACELSGDSRIKYIEAEENTENWGCYNRIKALSEVDTEYVIQTSVQDYFTPNSVDEILKLSGSDFIYWDSLHNHYNWEILSAEPQISKIDWGNFAIKTDIAKKVGINHPTQFAADGLFVTDCLNSGLVLTKKKIKKILTVHN